MSESMKYIGLQNTFVAFSTPSMSHAELRTALSLGAVDAGFISFCQEQHIDVWGESISLRLRHNLRHNAVVPLWHTIYWDVPYPHLIMTPNKQLQLDMVDALEKRFSGMDKPTVLKLSDTTPKILDCMDMYGTTRHYGPWDNEWSTTLTHTMYQTDWATEVRIIADDLVPPGVYTGALSPSLTAG